MNGRQSVGLDASRQTNTKLRNEKRALEIQAAAAAAHATPRAKRRQTRQFTDDDNTPPTLPTPSGASQITDRYALSERKQKDLARRQLAAAQAQLQDQAQLEAERNSAKQKQQEAEAQAKRDQLAYRSGSGNVYLTTYYLLLATYYALLATNYLR